MIESNGVILVNGVSIPTPSKYKTYPNLREQSTENSLGDIIRKIISCRWKIEMSWDILTKEQVSQLTDIKFLEDFTCVFPNSKGQRVTKKMYAGDFEPEASRISKNGKIVEEYENVALNFIQTKADKYTGGAV